MLAFIVRRLIQAVMVMLAVAFVAFLLFQYTGDPVNFMLGQDATPEQRAELRRGLGLDEPFIFQFGHFVKNASRGEFGLSLREGRNLLLLSVLRQLHRGHGSEVHSHGFGLGNSALS